MKTDILSGKFSDSQYQNLTFLSPGGMGDIYTADDINNSKKVAIKIMRITDQEFKDLLQEEFKIAMSLSHANIVRTDYYGEFTDSTGNYFYSVMEYLGNGSLNQKIKTIGTFFPIENCLSFFYDLLKGLQEAHKSIIHRDLKPANILIDDEGSLKICDFGIAKYVDHLTRTKTFKGSGTFPYMAPECWMNETNSKEMDIYSLGIIFFEILTLQLPFPGPNEKEFKEQHLFSTLPQILNIRNDAPITVIEIIRKMTNKRASERYLTIDEVIVAFNKIMEYSKANKLDISSLLTKINKKISDAAEAELRESQARETFKERQRVLNYSITQLFAKFISVIDVANVLLETNKITYKQNISDSNAAASSFIMNFFGKSTTISFYNEDILPRYIRESKEASIQHQKNTFGIVMSHPSPEHIETDNVVLIGKTEIHSSTYSEKPIGFNIVLRKKSENDFYGEWWICKFQYSSYVSNINQDFYFFFDPMEFFSEYHFGRQRAMHKYNMTFKEIEEIDILDLIERIV